MIQITSSDHKAVTSEIAKRTRRKYIHLEILKHTFKQFNDQEEITVETKYIQKLSPKHYL